MKSKLHKSMCSFSRSTTFDLQVYSKQIINYNNIVEFGAGIGRLCEFWLSQNKKVFAIENNQNFISILETKFKNQINKKEFLIFFDINQLNYFNDNTILIAPFNVIFHFDNLLHFVEIIKVAFEKNIKTIILDFDKLSKNDIENVSAKHIRKCGDFIEKGKLIDTGKYQITWFDKNNLKINKFNINLYSIEYIFSTIKQEISNIIITIITKETDIHGTEVLFVKLEKNENETI